MINSGKSREILLNHFLYALITGVIKAPNEWTVVAEFFDFPSYFSNHTHSHPHLIKGILRAIFYAMLTSEKAEEAEEAEDTSLSFRFYEVSKDIAVMLSNEQQESLLQYLLNKSVKQVC